MRFFAYNDSMVFSSTYFAFLFLPAVLLLCVIAPKQLHNYILLAASIFFYAHGEPFFVYVVIVSAFLNWAAALGMDRAQGKGMRRALLIASLVLDLGILFICKYLDFSISTINGLFHTAIPLQGIRLPIGISFYTFQVISYMIDVYTCRTECQKNFLYLALYIMFFPQLIAGPIVRYHSIAEQIGNRKMTLNGIGIGAKRFIYGFSKKILIANQMALIVQRCMRFGDTAWMPRSILWLGALAYTLQIYFDFSGYSDMAIGLGRMFGFRFEENFDHPYTARSVTDFWRKWHMSLSYWFRDYVYIPLGGNRGSIPFQIRNLFVVWLLTGIWHGANFTFVLWGLGYFVLLCLERYVIRPEEKPGVFRLFYRLFTLLAVCLLFVLFNAPDPGSAGRYIAALFGAGGNAGGLADAGFLQILYENAALLAAAVVLSGSLPAKAAKALRKVKVFNRWIFPLLVPVLCTFLFLWSASYLVMGAHNPFIYFNF